MSETLAWAIVNKNGHIIASCIGRTRKEAIIRLVDDHPDYPWRKQWRNWKRWGSRCVRVNVTALDSGGAGEVG